MINMSWITKLVCYIQESDAEHGTIWHFILFILNENSLKGNSLYIPNLLIRMKMKNESTNNFNVL